MASTLKTRRLQLASWWRKRCGYEPLPPDTHAAKLPVMWMYFVQAAAVFFGIIALTGILLSLHYEPSARPIYQHGKPVALAIARETVIVGTDTLCTRGEILRLPISGKIVEFPPEHLAKLQVMSTSAGVPLAVSPATASVEHTLMQEIPFGAVIRGIHILSVHCFAGCLLLSALMLFWKRGYRAPFELVWLLTLSIITVSCVSAFSGHILAWNLRAYMSAQIVFSALEYLPFGETAASLLRGGTAIRPELLPRIHALHVLVLPLGMLALLRSMLRLARRLGVEFRLDAQLLLRGALVMVVLGIASAILPIFGTYTGRLPVDISGVVLADMRVRPEWYFLAGYELLRLVPMDFAATLLALWGIFWLSLPFVGNTRRKRIIMWLTGAVCIVVAIMLGIFGAVG